MMDTAFLACAFVKMWLKKIDAIAQDTGRSRNEIIGMLLEFAVDRCSIE